MNAIFFFVLNNWLLYSEKTGISAKGKSGETASVDTTTVNDWLKKVYS